jgi:hypothetical protein
VFPLGNLENKGDIIVGHLNMLAASAKVRLFVKRRQSVTGVIGKDLVHSHALTRPGYKV